MQVDNLEDTIHPGIPVDVHPTRGPKRREEMRSLSCGAARKIPLGFLKEEIPELNTETSVSLQVEW